MRNFRKISYTKQYISELALELKKMAEQDGDKVLAMLLEMVAMQASQPSNAAEDPQMNN